MTFVRLPRRTCFAAVARFAVVALALSAAAAPALAQSGKYPERPIRFVVPFAPGGAIDVMSRPIADAMARDLGQTAVVENRAGAAGNIGAALVAKAPADGYTLLVGTSATHGANPALFNSPGYNAVDDFEPIMLWGAVPNILVVNAAKGDKTVQEIIERAKRRPDVLTYGSAGTGTSLHLAGVLFEGATGVKMVHVPYKGGAPASVDLMSGNLDMMFDTVAVALPNIRSGKLRPLAVAAAERHFALPDVPTFAELGIKGVEAATWAGLFAPKGTPAPVLASLRQAAEKAMADPRVLEVLKTNGVQVMGWPGERFGGFVASETKRWGKVVRDAGIQPQ
ncbi:MAG: Bug family tripartite tricarboxylate transporter substrate binding protein [Burkholderiaceae bacterium]